MLKGNGGEKPNPPLRSKKSVERKVNVEQVDDTEREECNLGDDEVDDAKGGVKARIGS